MKLRGSAVMYNILLVIGNIIFTCGHSYVSDQESTTVMLSRNRNCRSNFKLSARRDSYRIVYPEKGRHCEECVNCNIFTSWTCRLTFETDSFTLKSFEMCVDLSRQTSRRCLTSSAVYKLGSRYVPLPCSLRLPVTCLENEHEVEAIYTSAFPCGYGGETRIYLQPRNPPVFVLFKENRECDSHKDVLTTDHGTIVSEFSHRTNSNPDFCPILLQVNKWRKYKKFCFRIEFAEFLNTDFSIQVYSVDGDKRWKFGGSFKKEQKYCKERVRGGYRVSAELAYPNSLNNHRFIMKYSFEKKDDYDDDEVTNDDDDDSIPAAMVTLVIVAGPIVIIILLLCCCCLVMRRKKHARQAPAAGPAANRSRVNYPAAATTSSADESNHVPSAPLMNGENGTHDPPPSYESLFPIK